MSSYKLKPGLSSVFLPGAGKVTTKTILTGEQYQRFVPQFLVEVLEEVVLAPAAPFAVFVPESVVAPAPAPEPVVPAPVPASEPVVVPEPAPEPIPEPVVAPVSEPVIVPEYVPEPVVLAPITEAVPETLVAAPVPEVLQEVVPAPAAVLDSPEGAAPAIVEVSPSTPAARPVEKKKKR